MFPELDMKIIAAVLSPDTTSDIAAGWWAPHLDPDTDHQLVRSWAGETYELCAALARGEWVEELGEINSDMAATVRRMHGMEVDNKFLNPAWADITSDYRTMAERDLDILGLLRGEETFGHSFLSFTWEPRKVLPLLYSWLRRNGVEIIKRKVDSLDELEHECDLVVNCSGLGAWGLVPDQNMVPVSGHVLRVEASWVGSVMCDSREDSWAYIIPNRDSVVLGSMDTKGNWDTQVQEGDMDAIRRRCDKLCPGVKASNSAFSLFRIFV
jgi:glycine/D-amino acid oxidase-like deaminating enzyme